MTEPMKRPLALLGAIAAIGLASPAPAVAQFRQEIANDLTRCNRGDGPAVLVTVNGVRSSAGRIRVQAYRATAADWLQKGRWLNRIEQPARSGSMTFCVPVPASGSYGIAVRHDANGNGETDISEDGGGMSNNPSINIFNLGRPSYRATAFAVGASVSAIRIQMKYM
jgi:uncharacterized protein (DUF2141 family)